MYDRIVRILDDDREHVTYGGDTAAAQFFISPTLLNFQTNFDSFTSSASMQEEIFGPLLPVVYYIPDNLEIPIQFFNGGEKPLALYYFSSNSNKKERAVSEISAGSMMINDVTMQLYNLNVPFGGVGNSWMGAYHGHYGFAGLFTLQARDLQERIAGSATAVRAVQSCQTECA
ncbi:Fatty aldehyde dehydrogenase [Phytophthora citrophthora]|uniref:Fatty aldehyde dehydrogenase n=1 Tax=Phytophthora citrophthora TaxID=4793 RepID=A0AAD9GIU2_9STRA|nr:Fatty aldehyde dehydrogenase [Phytophthora citrophthora]